MSKSGNLELGEEMVQYCYEPVQGDQVRIFPKFSRDFFFIFDLLVTAAFKYHIAGEHSDQT